MDSQSPETMMPTPHTPKRSSRSLNFDTPEDVLKARAERAEAEAEASQEMAEAKEAAARRCAEVAEEERHAREAADAREEAMRQKVGLRLGPRSGLFVGVGYDLGWNRYDEHNCASAPAPPPLGQF